MIDFYDKLSISFLQICFLKKIKVSGIKCVIKMIKVDCVAYNGRQGFTSIVSN